MKGAACLLLAACTSSAAGTQPSAPVATTPHALFEDFTNPGAQDRALIDKYAAGVTFAATIKTVGAEHDGSPVVWIDVDGESLFTLEIATPAPSGLAAGMRRTFTCKIGGASGALLVLTSCLVRDL